MPSLPFRAGVSLWMNSLNDWGKEGARMSITEILESSVEERLRIIGVIWDSITNETDHIPLTEAQREDLDRRIDAYEKGEDQGYTWEEVLTRIKGRK